MKVYCIAALSENFVIGRENKLPWHLPADLKFFKQRTMGHTMLVGRLSYESAGGPLPGRKTILLTNQPGYAVPQGVQLATNLQHALELAAPAPEVYVLGGEGVFREAIEGGLATHLVLTRVHAHVEGDTRFPHFSQQEWKRAWHEPRPADSKNVYAMTFEIWERA